MPKLPPWPKIGAQIHLRYSTHLPAWMRRRRVPTFEIGRKSGKYTIVLARFWLN